MRVGSLEDAANKRKLYAQQIRISQLKAKESNLRTGVLVGALWRVFATKIRGVPKSFKTWKMLIASTEKPNSYPTLLTEVTAHSYCRCSPQSLYSEGTVALHPRSDHQIKVSVSEQESSSASVHQSRLLPPSPPSLAYVRLNRRNLEAAMKPKLRSPSRLAFGKVKVSRSD